MAKSHKQSSTDTEVSAPVQSERKPFPPGFSPVEQARKLHESMDRWGTDERVIFDVLRSGRADLNHAIESAFNRMYPKRSLRSWLREELGGSEYTKAIQLLGQGDYTLAQKLENAAEGWGADEQQIFRALELASPSELQEVWNNASLMQRLDDELNDGDFQLAKAYLSGNAGLAAKLRQAVHGWGTDEKAIWRAINKASDSEKQFVLGQPSLMQQLRSDLNDSDYFRVQRMLSGSWDNVDKIEVSMKGWGTDESTLLTALHGLNDAEFHKLNEGTSELPNGVSSLQHRLESELSGDVEFEAMELLHQKRLQFDPDYCVQFQAQQSKAMGTEAMQSEGASALLAGEGQGMSAVARLKKACHGWGTDEKSIWEVCASIPKEQGRWILQNNPENVLGILQSELSADEYFKVRRALGGGALGRIQVLRNAVEGVGTNERQIYDAMDAILAEGLGPEVLLDGSIVKQIRNDIGPRMFAVFRTALQTGHFSPMMRLTWATARYGTDEELVWEVCRDHGANWYKGGQIEPGVDALLKSELSTRDYWKAIDLLRGPPASEQDRLARAKELLERERSAEVSVWLMDQVSDSGQNADEAWRDYQVAYNQSHEDGVVSEQETARMREAEQYSEYTTEQYRKAKATVAQWASQIAITIIGIVATVLTAGAAAGPFIAALGANASQIATTMVLSAVAKVGIQKAIEGEGYDLTSVDTLIDGVGAAIEGGLFVVGNMGAARIMAGASKTQFVKGIGPSVEKVFGGAGKRILAGGLEGAIDGTIGGMGEGLFRGLANEENWADGLGQAFTRVSTTTLLHGSLGGGMGLVGGGLFRSVGETFGPALRNGNGRVSMRTDADLGASKTGTSNGVGQGSVDDILVKKPVDFGADTTAQTRLMHAVHQTNQRMQVVADDITAEFGLAPTKVGIKGNRFGVENASDLNQHGFVSAVSERAMRRKRPQSIGNMRDMSRGRFDCENIEQVRAVVEALDSRFTQAYGADNVQILYRNPDDVYQRIHVLVRDPQTGVRHEWQVGTKALTTLIEDVSVAVPKGVELHGYDFHTVVYDVLEKLRRSDIRAKYGLPDTIVDDIGFSKLTKDYDALMIEAGTVKSGSTQPVNFDERLIDMARRLTQTLEKLEDSYPGLATKLDTKLAAKKAAAKLNGEGPNQVRPESSVDGPVSQKDMPWFRPKEPVKPKPPDDPQPLLREEHQSTGQYVAKKKATPFLSDGSLSPHSAKQGQLGNCYLIAGCAAQVRADPNSVRRLIEVNADGSFTVTLYIRDHWYSDAVAKKINVDNKFPVKGGSLLYARTGEQLKGEDEMWMAIIEKAMAKEAGGYGNISGGQVNKHINFGGVHELLTGNKVSYVHTKKLDADELLQRLSSALDDKEPISAGTWDFSKEVAVADKAEVMDIYPNHAYSVESVNMTKRTVTLQNPWGSRHPTDVPIEDFAKYYDRLDIGTSAVTKEPVIKGPLPEDGSVANLGLGQASDNLPMAVLRSTDAGLLSVTSGKVRSDVESVMAETLLQTSDVEYPGEQVRALFWSHMNSPKIIRFQGRYTSQDAVFFLNPDSKTVVVTELSGTFLKGLTLNDYDFEALLATGRL